jgi:hypothetical protein
MRTPDFPPTRANAYKMYLPPATIFSTSFFNDINLWKK